MADINATDLTEETISTLDGSEQFVMFDSIEGKRARADVIAEYATGDKDDLTTTDKSSIVDAINEVNGKATGTAKTDGNYPELGAGQLLSDTYTEDKKPYLFRALPYDSTRLYDKIVGGTVAWNQLADLTINDAANVTKTLSNTSITLTSTSDSTTLKGVYLKRNLTENHVYMFGGAVTAISGYNSFIGIFASGNSTRKSIINDTATAVRDLSLYKVTNGTDWFGIRMTNTAPSDSSAVFDDVMLIVLTQMFGSAIADYIYSLETANAGAGVAWFKKLFPKDYYAYNAGQLMSVKTSAHQMVGFNQWDEQWEKGTYDLTTGQPVVSNSYFRTKNPIPVLPNTSYYWYTDTNDLIYIFQYDAGGNYIKYNSRRNELLTTASNCRYIRFVDTDRNIYNNHLCVNLSWDGERDGDYEAYKKWTYPLDSDLELRGIPKLDASNILYYDGDTYEADGTINRRFGIVDLGALTYARSSSITNGFVAVGGIPNDFPLAPSTSAIPNWLCSQYEAYSNTGIEAAGVDKAIAWRVSGTNKGVIIRDSQYASYYNDNDMVSFKTAMSGVYLVYELATPTTEEADPFTNPQVCAPNGTEEYTTSNGVPVGHETKYLENLKGKLENMPSIPKAPTTDGTYTLTAMVSGGVATYSWE